ncbi:MAG: hypothetical protein K8M05_41805 [Deltaproteobacteria bacterium]|nr:hypothetical protein [Kofleriaceae bacterium]
MQRTLITSMAMLGLALAACTSDPSSGDDDGVDVDASVGEPDASPAACGGSTCETPPAAVCADAFTLRVFLDDGACVADACQFTTDDVVCPYGCGAGACNAHACAPSCPTATCTPDGCGGMCGACPSGATFPGFAPVVIGSAAEGVVVSPDGLQLAVTRELQPHPAGCGWNPERVGTLDVYTIAASGQATRRIVGRRVQLGTVRFTGDAMIYMEDTNPCDHRADLWVARADGSAPRRIAQQVLPSAEIAGDTVFWHRPDPDDLDQSTYDGHVYAAALDLGAPRQLAVDDYGTWSVPSPDGSAVFTAGDAVRTQIARVSVHDTATGASLALTPTTWAPKYRGPWWSPDGDRLLFLHSASGYAPYTLTAVNEDGGGRTDLSSDAASDSYHLTFSSDGTRVVFVERTAAGAQDVVVRDLATGATARLTGAAAAGSGYTVWRTAFSRDEGTVLVLVGPPTATDSRPFRMLRGPASGGALATIVEPLGRDGQGFMSVVQEAPDGRLAVMASDSTRVITPAGAVTTISGAPYEAPVFDASGQRLLVDTTRTSLRVFPGSGAGTGTALPSYAATSALASQAYFGYVPFVFGWWGSLALYPSNVSGSYPQVQLDVRAWDETRSGVLGARVLRYALAGDRVVFLTTDGAVFAGRRP